MAGDVVNFFIRNPYYEWVGELGNSKNPVSWDAAGRTGSRIAKGLSTKNTALYSEHDVSRAWKNLGFGVVAILALQGVIVGPLRGTTSDLGKVIRNVGGLGTAVALIFNVAPGGYIAASAASQS